MCVYVCPCERVREGNSLISTDQIIDILRAFLFKPIHLFLIHASLFMAFVFYTDEDKFLSVYGLGVTIVPLTASRAF